MLRTEKKLFTSLAQEMKLLEIENLYSQDSNIKLIPDKLYHYIEEDSLELTNEAISYIKQNGLENAKNPRPITKIIDNKVDRPLGIYFWGTPVTNQPYIEINISALDFNKLYVFPHFIADTILELQNYKVALSFWHKLRKIAKTIPFTEYKGQFKAEYIYTKDIPAHLLNIRR